MNSTGPGILCARTGDARDSICAFVVGCSFLVLYGRLIATVVERWFTRPHSYGHGAIILALSAWMLWTKRRQLRALDVRAAPWSGATILLAGCAAMFLATITLTDTLAELSLLVSLAGAVLLVAGRKVFLCAAFPLAYLVFMFPIFDIFLGRHVIVLQETTAYIASLVLAACGYPVHRTGHVLELPHITLSVVKACSGTNHIVSLMAVAFPLGFFTQRTKRGIAVLAAAALVIGMAANGVRIALVGIWTAVHPESQVHGPADMFLVSFVFSVGLVLLVVLAYLVKPVFGAHGAAPAADAPNAPAGKTACSRGAVAGAAAILLGTAAGIWFFTARPATAVPDFGALPATFGSWHGRSVESLDEPFEAVRPDVAVKRVYEDECGVRIHVYAAWFARQEPERELFARHYNSLLSNAHSTEIELPDGERARVLEFRYDAGAGRRQGFGWYALDGRFLPGRRETKLQIVWSTLMKRANAGGIVLITMPAQEPPAGERNAAALRDLTARMYAAFSRIAAQGAVAVAPGPSRP